MTGPLNLRLVAPNYWHSLSKVADQDLNLSNLELNFLNEFKIPSNKDLGLYIDRLYYSTPSDEPFKLSATKLHKTQTFKADFPTHHSIKLCLQGKAFSGKKTQAQKIIEKLGADKVALFDMQEIIREVLILCDPNA
jgi:hypothetical protein